MPRDDDEGARDSDEASIGEHGVMSDGCQSVAVQAAVICGNTDLAGSDPGVPWVDLWTGLALPDAFDGSRSNLKCFSTQCLLYMAVRSNDFPDDLSRIAFVLSLMKGSTAGPWATRMIKTLTHALTWEQFDWDLQDAFGKANPGAAARAKLEALQMGTSTADEFIQQFEALADESELDEVTLTHLFECGLHCSVTEKIYGVKVMPKTLKGWKEYASHFDNQYHRF